MGITGLLPFLKNATREANIKEFRGYTVAIDSYCWLHKGAFSCAEKLALGEKTDQYVYYCLKFINTLLSYDIKPIMVFDGCRLPSKREVEKQRREKRESYKKKAAQLLREGKRTEARDALKLSLDITSEMALNLMDACRNKGVDCIVAPYEADAQLAYLNKLGIAQVVITEDSDLVLFGCEKIMYKMDFNGNGLLVEKTNLNKTVDFRADLYSFEKFRYMCILSGCDYLASLKGIGLKKAMMIFQRTRQTDMTVVIKKIPTTLNLNVTVVPDYIDGFFRANNTFLYQLVYDPLKRRQVPLHPYPDGVLKEDLQYAGPYMKNEVAYQLALGNLSVYDMSVLSDFDPDTFKPKSRKWNQDSRLCMLSIWDKNYRPMSNIAEKQSKSGYEKEADIDKERKTTKSQEIKVNISGFKKKSPTKRLREPEVDVLSDKQLTTLYGSSHSVTSESSPAKRRKSIVNCSELISDDKSVLDNLTEMLHENDNDGTNIQQKNQNGGEVTPDMDKEIIPVNSKSPVQPDKKINKRVKVFRASASKNKESFKLNATTEVVSRFFTSSEKKFRKSSFYNKLEADSDQNTSKDEEEIHCDLQLSKQITDDKNVISSPEENSDSTTQPYGSFGFKLKLDSFKSGFSDKECGAVIMSSNNVGKQFKPVIDRTKLSKTLSRSSALDSCENVNSQNSSICSSQRSESFKNVSLSQGGDLYSIDGDSFGLNHSQSQRNDHETLPYNLDVQCTSNMNNDSKEIYKSSTQKRQKPLFYLEDGPKKSQTDVHDIDTEIQFVENLDNFKSSPNSSLNGFKTMGLCKSSGSLPGSGNSKKSLSGCRSSGLAKKSKVQMKNNENSQASIKSFFSSFSYDKRKQEKLACERKPLSPKKDNFAD